MTQYQLEPGTNKIQRLSAGSNIFEINKKINGSKASIKWRKVNSKKCNRIGRISSHYYPQLFIYIV
jgi:hypothetical protein